MLSRERIWSNLISHFANNAIYNFLLLYDDSSPIPQVPPDTYRLLHVSAVCRHINCTTFLHFKWKRWLQVNKISERVRENYYSLKHIVSSDILQCYRFFNELCQMCIMAILFRSRWEDEKRRSHWTTFYYVGNLLKKKIIVAEVMTLSFENSRDESILNCFRGNKQFRFNDSEKFTFFEEEKKLPCFSNLLIITQST